LLGLLNRHVVFISIKNWSEGATELKCLKYIRLLRTLQTLIPAVSALLKLGCAGDVSQGFGRTGLSPIKMDYDTCRGSKPDPARPTKYVQRVKKKLE